MNYTFVKLTLGVIATFGLYSVLYRETKFYRFFEHMFLGLAAGWAMTAMWTEVLYDLWWMKMVGSAAENAQPATPGYWAWAFMLPLGLMAYFVFSERHGWMSRIPIGVILGLWAGQQVQVWWNRYGPQMENSIRPMIPTSWDSLFVPATQGLDAEAAALVRSTTYASEAVNNIIFLATMLCVMSYFIFSVDFKNRFLRGMTTSGRWLLMVGFGAIFGSTVMTRFTLLIDRMYFVWIEWLRDAVIRGGGGG